MVRLKNYGGIEMQVRIFSEKQIDIITSKINNFLLNEIRGKKVHFIKQTEHDYNHSGYITISIFYGDN